MERILGGEAPDRMPSLMTDLHGISENGQVVLPLFAMGNGNGFTFSSQQDSRTKDENKAQPVDQTRKISSNALTCALFSGSEVERLGSGEPSQNYRMTASKYLLDRIFRGQSRL
jgi:hypothetical protein